jgi:hypothetical protein
VATDPELEAAAVDPALQLLVEEVPATTDTTTTFTVVP